MVIDVMLSLINMNLRQEVGQRESRTNIVTGLTFYIHLD